MGDIISFQRLPYVIAVWGAGAVFGPIREMVLRFVKVWVMLTFFYLFSWTCYCERFRRQGDVPYF
jgi:hypothetical protein